MTRNDYFICNIYRKNNDNNDYGVRFRSEIEFTPRVCRLHDVDVDNIPWVLAIDLYVDESSLLRVNRHGPYSFTPKQNGREDRSRQRTPQ